jgi:hypothetical protein
VLVQLCCCLCSGNHNIALMPQGKVPIMAALPAVLPVLKRLHTDGRRCCRLPAPGTEVFQTCAAAFVAVGRQEVQRQLGMLPQAHTCDNLLELPDY